MRATYVPPVRTTVAPAEVSRAYFEALIALTGKLPTPEAVAVLHAQCALETGNMAACWNWNLGNIKAGLEYEGLYTCIRLNERLKQGDGSMAYVWFSPEGEERPKGNVIKSHAVPPGHPQTRMRAHATLAEGVAKKIGFLLGPRWRPALDVALAGDASGYVVAIRARGYFTAELAPYQRAVVSLAAKLLPVARGAQPEPDPIDDDAQLCADMSECRRGVLPDWLLARVNLHVATLDVDWAELKRDRTREIDDFTDEPTDPAIAAVDMEDDPDTSPETPESKT